MSLRWPWICPCGLLWVNSPENAHPAQHRLSGHAAPEPAPARIPASVHQPVQPQLQVDVLQEGARAQLAPQVLHIFRSAVDWVLHLALDKHQRKILI